MANIDAKFGLVPIRHLNGSPFNGQVERVYVPDTDGTAIFIGDAVKSAGSADADGVPSVAQVAAGDAIRGVVVGVEQDGSDLETQYRKADTEAYLYIVSAPDVVFAVQSDAAVAAADIGRNADIVVGSGDTVWGLSGMELDIGAIATADGQLRMIGMYPRGENELGDAVILEVVINEHEFKQAAGVA